MAKGGEWTGGRQLPKTLNLGAAQGMKINTCRFPLWDLGRPDGRYCGQDVRHGSAYCEKHHKVCYRKTEGVSDE